MNLQLLDTTFDSCKALKIHSFLSQDAFDFYSCSLIKKWLPKLTGGCKGQTTLWNIYDFRRDSGCDILPFYVLNRVQQAVGINKKCDVIWLMWRTVGIYRGKYKDVKVKLTQGSRGKKGKNEREI